MNSIFTSPIRSDFAGNKHGNFEAVIKVGNDFLDLGLARRERDVLFAMESLRC